MTYRIYFSPTGQTEKIVKYASGIIAESAEDIDLTENTADIAIGKDDLCVVGVPSFGGRVPNTAAERLRKISGDNTPVFLIVTYGGRAYEDTLKELKDILEAQSFICIGAAAMVTEHSIVPEIAAGRPNENDFNQLAEFIIEIKNRLKDKITSIDVAGNTPYRNYSIAKMEIQTSDSCIQCGLCSKMCPAGAIPKNNPMATDYEKCISCMRCISICPANARSCNPKKLSMLTEKLHKIYTPDKENEFF